jgi:hypothetical protein
MSSGAVEIVTGEMPMHKYVIRTNPENPITTENHCQ